MARDYDHLFKLLIIGDSGEFLCIFIWINWTNFAIKVDMKGMNEMHCYLYKLLLFILFGKRMCQRAKNKSKVIKKKYILAISNDL